jgi:uncharacterized membrane protein YdjX (TVP38/TMEM64 family)
MVNDLKRTSERLWDAFMRMSMPQKLVVILVCIALVAGGVGFMILTRKLFDWLEPVAEDWEKKPATYIVLGILTFGVSFPPLVGWSTLGTVCGFIFGVWKGYVVLFPCPSYRRLY